MRIIAPGANVPRIRGVFYIAYNTKLQRHVVHAWPKKRSQLSPITAAQNANLVTVMALLKRRTGEDQQGAIDLTAGTPFLAQDALVSAAQGTLFPQIAIGGDVLWSARIMASDIQALLNSISSIEGTILVRTATQWEALLPGGPNQVLTIDATTGQPSWEDPQGGGGGSGGSLMPGFQSGLHYFSPVLAGASMGYTAITANRLYAVPFSIPDDTVFDAAQVQCQTGASGKSIALGVFSNSNGLPFALESDFGHVSAAAAGTLGFTGLAVTITKGWHWLVVASDGTPTLRRGSVPNAAGNLILPSSTDFINYFGKVPYMNWTFSTSGLPSLFVHDGDDTNAYAIALTR